MRNYLLLILVLATLAACTSQMAEPGLAEASLSRPSQGIPAGDKMPPAMPYGDFFYSLPNYDVGEVITLDGYTAQLAEVNLEGNLLQIDLQLANESGRPIDLVWAVQLIREDVGYIAPQASPVQESKVGEASLAESDSLGGVWNYDLTPEGLSSDSQIDLDDYRLLYAPFGWAGPVFVFRLTPPSR